MSLTIAIDAMGGDFGPEITIPASLECLNDNPELKLILVGDAVNLNDRLGGNLSEFADRLTIKHASQQVEMHEVTIKSIKK